MFKNEECLKNKKNLTLDNLKDNKDLVKINENHMRYIQQSILLTEKDFYPPTDNREFKSGIQDIPYGDKFRDYVEDYFENYCEDIYF